jgi:outer membrane lipoprotein SlyB
MTKTVLALSAALVVAGSSFALADNFEETKSDIYPNAVYTHVQSAGYEALASARQVRMQAARGWHNGYTIEEMRQFNRIDPHGF